jgi:hypothetical protein
MHLSLITQAYMFLKGTVQVRPTRIGSCETGGGLNSEVAGTVRLCSKVDNVKHEIEILAAFTPKSTLSLVSWNWLDDVGYSMGISGGRAKIYDAKGLLVANLAKVKKMFWLNWEPGEDDFTNMSVPRSLEVAHLASTYFDEKLMTNGLIYHQRWAHISSKLLNLSYSKYNLPNKCQCVACVIGKSHFRAVPKRGSGRTYEVGERIDLDVNGPYPPSWEGYCYCARRITQRAKITSAAYTTEAMPFRPRSRLPPESRLMLEGR